MSNEIIMNVTPGETRIARFDSGVLTELSIERDSDLQVAGNIYLGRITRVLPGMQAAFVDIGLEKAAFLYVADVVPDLFEGITDEDLDEVGKQNGGEGTDNESSGIEDGPDGMEGPEEDAPAPEPSQQKDGKGPQTANAQRGGRRFSRRPPPRRSRGPLPRIEDVVKEGQTIVVQVAKEPIRTKGARITSHISLPGRYLVYMPTVKHVGVSRRISSYEERMRLKEILHNHKPATGGFIARTSSIGASEEKLVDDMKNLTETWQKIYQAQEKSRPPATLHTDLDIVLRSVRDNLSTDVDRLVIDSKEDYDHVMEFVDKNMPELKNRVHLYDKDTPLFDVYGIENEITRALGKKVWLKSGGYLIIDSSEALTAIDVNTGKFVGKRDFDETIMTTNLEAVDEIAYQLKLRSIGGIIILDFIDMQRYADRTRVYHALKDALRKDRVKTTMSKISDLGLIEMTRKRVRDSLTQMLSEPCSYCNGTGFVKTPITIAFEAFREIRRVYAGIPSKSILVTTHPRVAKVLFNEGRERLEQLEDRIKKRIVVETDEKYHLERFEIRGRETQALPQRERPSSAGRDRQPAPEASVQPPALETHPA
jgi:ribonuclease G